MTSSQQQDIADLPQTTTVFDKPALEFDMHDWLQEGYILRDVCSQPTSACEPVGIPIPSGKLLVRKDGHYDLVDERR